MHLDQNHAQIALPQSAPSVQAHCRAWQHDKDRKKLSVSKSSVSRFIGLLARFGPIRSTSQLQQLPLIHADDHGQEWAKWVQCWSHTSIALRVEASVDTPDAAIQLALMGQGIAMADPLFIREDIATGALVLAHPNAYESGETYYLVHRLSPSADEKVNRLKVWLLQRLTDTRKLSTAT